MKKLLLTICTLGILHSIYAQNLDRSIRPKAGPAPTINIADAKSFTLPNGLKVFVVENNKLPKVSYSIQFDLDVPNQQDKAGLGEIFGSMLTAGTKKRSKQQFLDEKENIGANISASKSSIFASSLTKHQDKLLELVADILLNPNFSQEELDKLKTQTISGLTMAETNAEAIMNNVSKVVVYGKNHPYAEVPTEASVTNIKLEDISKYYRTYFRPNVAYMAVVGDVTLDEAKKLVTKYFSKWEKANVPKAEYPKVPAVTATTVSFAEKQGAVQSEIAIENAINLPYTAPDLVHAKVMNYILGGGSSSKLFTNLREDKAWTYGSYSGISQDEHIGSFTATAKCRNEVTDSAVAEILKEMSAMRTTLVDKKVLAGAKNYLNGVFALGLRSPQTIAAYAINIDKYKLPKDYYKSYMQKTAAVTPTDIKNAANKYLTPHATNIIVVGSNAEAPKLKRFAKDGVINYYDKYGNPTKAPESKEVVGITATDVIDNYIKAIGGKDNISKVKSITSNGNTSIQGMNVEIKQVVVSPNKSYKAQIISVPGQTIEILQVLNGDKAYSSQMGQKQEITGDALAKMQLEADLQSILNPEKHGISYTLVNQTEVDGNAAYLLEKTDKSGNKVQQFYDVKSGLLIREIENQEAQGQTITSTTDYQDYKEVEGMKGYLQPRTVKVSSNGPIPQIEIKFTNIKANDKVDNTLFN